MNPERSLPMSLTSSSRDRALKDKRRNYHQGSSSQKRYSLVLKATEVALAWGQFHSAANTHILVLSIAETSP